MYGSDTKAFKLGASSSLLVTQGCNTNNCKPIFWKNKIDYSFSFLNKLKDEKCNKHLINIDVLKNYTYIDASRYLFTYSHLKEPKMPIQ